RAGERRRRRRGGRPRPPAGHRTVSMAAGIKVGLILPMFSGDPGRILVSAVEAERLGFDGVFVFDHFFPPGGSSDRPSVEAFTMLAAVAARTRRIRVGT